MTSPDTGPDPLTLDEVAHVAALARLKLDRAQLERYRAQLSSVLDHISRLRELDVSGVEPMAHPTGLTNRLDEDEIRAPMPVETLLELAPDVEDSFLAVPKVLG